MKISVINKKRKDGIHAAQCTSNRRRTPVTISVMTIMIREHTTIRPAHSCKIKKVADETTPLVAAAPPNANNKSLTMGSDDVSSGLLLVLCLKWDSIIGMPNTEPVMITASA